MAFHVGQRVRCIVGGRIRNDNPDIIPADVYPITGREYTIRQIFFDPHHGLDLIRLAEVINPERRYRLGIYENGWCPSRFRPVKDTTTQVELLKSLLIPKPIRKRVKA